MTIHIMIIIYVTNMYSVSFLSIVCILCEVSFGGAKNGTPCFSCILISTKTVLT